MRAKDAVGAYGEGVAARWLAAAGYAVLDRNWRCPAGEVDLVCATGGTLCFVEVKCRRGLWYGGPLESVTAAKAARVRTVAEAWLAAHRVSYEVVRFDVVGVLRPRSGPAVVEHVAGAF